MRPCFHVARRVSARREHVAVCFAALAFDRTRHFGWTCHSDRRHDNDFLADMLRERLQALDFSLEGARYAPTHAEIDELGALGQVQADAAADYARLMNAQAAKLDTPLKAAGLQPVR